MPHFPSFLIFFLLSLIQESNDSQAIITYIKRRGLKEKVLPHRSAPLKHCLT
ncbi:hypothetical protein GLYMA_18G108432v4 [Glycine max]|nr:hypothetical protein GLYMA_18G108432v4 [Glycine max]KAH1154054.1 hypothetical protein GYH30_049611 [Glycine max]